MIRKKLSRNGYAGWEIRMDVLGQCRLGTMEKEIDDGMMG